MSGMTLETLLERLPFSPLSVDLGPGQTPVVQVTADSREVTPGSLFVAVPGLRRDGHTFIPQAVERGAVAVVGTREAAALRDQGLLPLETPYVQVADARAALAWLAAALHNFPARDLVVAGVTGTDGKTTTCTLLEAMLSAYAGRDRVGAITTIAARIGGEEQDTGFHVTTPEAPQVQAYLAQMRERGCRYAVVESTSHGLDQQRVAAVDFDVAVVTNITHEHLDYHGSYEAYRAAKARLFQALFHTPPKPGVPRVAVLNRDDPGSFEPLQAVLAEEAARPGAPTVQVRTYSLYDPAGDVTAHAVRTDPDATRFRICWWGGEFPVETRLIGLFNVANILAAATAALGLGLPPQAVQAGVAGVPGVLGRMERIDCGQDFLAVVDFAHSPVSLERALETLRPLVSPGGRLIAIFGSAGLRDRAKRRLMGRVSGRLADFTIITAEDPRTEDVHAICAEIAAGVAEFAPPSRYTVIPDRAEAIRAGISMAQAGDVVASFGKGHERSMCYGEIEYPWSDQEAMRRALLERLKKGLSTEGSLG